MRHNGRPRIFVFGSNLAGRHGKGAALTALKNFGAVYGKPVGLQGRSYAIPTKDHMLKPLPLTTIAAYIDLFIRFAEENTHLFFEITRVGCGLAGFDWEKDIRPLFPAVLPENCVFIHLPTFDLGNV
jgi:hypothetical protein